jgi:hypothetical protein
MPQDEPAVLHEDSQSLIKMTLSCVDQERCKHWDAKIFALREMATKFIIRMGYVSAKIKWRTI